MNRVFIYARKSSESEDRQVASVESQLKELSDVVKKSKLQVANTYRESQSAKAPGRPQFNLMIEEISKGTVQSVVCWKLDRLARNPVDGGSIIWAVNQLGLQIVTPTKIYTKDDLLLMYVEFGMANQFINDLSKNTKRGLKAKAEKGWLPSGAKPGYMNDKYAERGNKTVVKDPDRFPLIRKAWELMLTGEYTPPKVLTVMNKEWGYRTPKRKRLGGKPMTRSYLYKVFTDPFYYGEFEYPVGSGNWYKGKHEPMITKDEFQRVQAILGRKIKARPKTRVFDYTGLFECGECGAAITAEDKLQCICTGCKKKFSCKTRDNCSYCGLLISEMSNPVILHYIYYHCTKRVNPKCTQGSITKEEFEKQVDKKLSKIQISERFKDWAIKYLNEANESETEDRNKVLTSLQEAYNDCVKRIDNLVKLKISPHNSDGSLLSDDEFRNQKESLIKEKASLEEKLGDTDDRIDKWIELTEKTFNFACYARHWFANGTREQKRSIFHGLGSNLKLFDKTVLIDVDKPYEEISKLRDEEDSISPMFEPEKVALTLGYLEDYWSQNPSVLPD